MPQRETLRVRGYKEFLKACAKMPKETRKEIRGVLRQVGQRVRNSAANKTSNILLSGRSAHGYRVVVRTRGVAVEQSLRKTTGLRGDWGVDQMRYSLIPALESHKTDTEQAMEKAMVELADLFTLLARWQGEGLIGPL